MKFLGIDIPIVNKPELDETCVPLSLFFRGHQKLAKEPYAVAVERTGGLVSVFDAKVIGTEEYAEADAFFIDRVVKFMLWARGGFKVYLCGIEKLAQDVNQAYTDAGSRCFDKNFTENVYEHPF